MSTIIEHSANASAITEYKGKIKHGKFPTWIRQKQLENYYASMNEFYSECLEELSLPKRFDKSEIHARLMAELRNMIRQDGDFTSLVLKLIQNYPHFPMDSKAAGEYVIALKNLSARVAEAGLKSNNELAWDAIISDIPYIVFSNLYLGTYAVSYFHAYKSKVTEQHFRHNYLLVRGRPNLKTKKIAIDNYFHMIKPLEEQFKVLLKAQFKLWLFITLANSESIKEFPQKIMVLKAENLDQQYLEKLKTEHEKVLEQMRRHLFVAEPELFNPTSFAHKPTETMWKDMVLVRATE
jgi:hypothetical protein